MGLPLVYISINHLLRNVTLHRRLLFGSVMAFANYFTSLPLRSQPVPDYRQIQQLIEFTPHRRGVREARSIDLHCEEYGANRQCPCVVIVWSKCQITIFLTARFSAPPLYYIKEEDRVFRSMNATQTATLMHGTALLLRRTPRIYSNDVEVNKMLHGCQM